MWPFYRLQANAVIVWFMLMVCAPLAFAIPKGAAVFLAVMLLALAGTKPISTPNYGLAARIALWISVALFAWQVLANSVHGLSLRNVDTASRLLLLPFAAYIAATRPVSATAIGQGFFLLVVAEVAVMAWQLTVDPTGIQRASGTTGRPLISAAFAWVAAMVVFVTVKSMDLSAALRALIRFSVILLGATAIALAGARGVAVAVPFSMLVVAVLTRKTGVALLGVGLFVVLVLLPGLLGHRILADLPTDLEQLKKGNASTPVGARIEMWSVAGDLLASNPWIGVGSEGYKSIMSAKLAAGEVSVMAAQWGEPHNDYLMFGAFYGVPALVLFLLFMATLIVAFVTVVREARETERGPCSIAGICIVVNYLVYCATSSFFAAQSAISYFAFFVGLLLGISYRPERTHLRA
jgi:O-antigen ligase